MRLVQSAGILIQSNNKVLLAHATGQKPDNGWGLPKGRVDDGESLTQAAVRETQEECGLVIPANELQMLTTVSYPSKDEHGRIKKELTIFLYNADEDIQKQPLICTTYFNPPWVKNPNVKIPEIDKFKWVDIEEAKSFAMKSIRPVFDLL
jgi:ADP-ribose pyrophosphatase YjhB (NUDIX family)